MEFSLEAELFVEVGFLGATAGADFFVHLLQDVECINGNCFV